MERNDIADLIMVPETLLMIYRQGLFPMAEDRHSPGIFLVETLEQRARAEIPLALPHFSRSFRKELKKDRFNVTIDGSFEEVIHACADPARRKDGGTWINDTIIEAYSRLHRRGCAHSIECRDASGKLAGGLYGVRLGRIFFGESVFSDRPDAGKIALVNLMARLHRGGFGLLEVQMVTPLTESFGARRIGVMDYHAKLKELQWQPADFELPGLSQEKILHDYLSAQPA